MQMKSIENVTRFDLFLNKSELFNEELKNISKIFHIIIIIEIKVYPIKNLNTS